MYLALGSKLQSHMSRSKLCGFVHASGYRGGFSSDSNTTQTLLARYICSVPVTDAKPCGVVVVGIGRAFVAASVRLPVQRRRRLRCCRHDTRMRSTATTSPGSDDPIEETRSKEKETGVSAWAERQHRTRINLVGVFFLLVTFAWSLPLFIIMLILYPFVLILDPYRARVYDWIAMLWMRLSMLSTGIHPRVVGTENLLPPDATVLYVCNHNSYLDIYTVAFLGRFFKFVSKRSIFAIPIIGWAMGMARQIGIERDSRRDQLRVFREMVSRLEHGVSLLLFPEGTRSKDGTLRAFKQGPFRVAKQAGVPIVPLTITGTAEVMPPWALAPLRWPKQRITLTIHPAIQTADHSVTDLIEAARTAIASALPPGLCGR